MAEIRGDIEWQKAVEAAGGDERIVEQLEKKLEEFGIFNPHPHFLRRLIERFDGMQSINKIVETWYQKSGTYYDPKTGNYVTINRKRSIALVETKRGKPITVFSCSKPKQKWVKVPRPRGRR